MDYKLLVFITLASCCFAAELPCPQDCRCRAYKLSNVHATCTNLDPKSQKFLMKVNHLKVVNQHHGEGLILTDKFFVEMGLDKLETIRITNSSVKQVHPAAFHGLENLRLIDLSGNDIKKLDSETFINNKNLKHLILNGNPIQIGHSEKPFLSSDSILELTLSNCDIARIPPGTFSNLRNLEFLDLSGNRLSEINADTFGRLINLETLHLGNNRISKIDKKAFDDMDELSMLSLKGNNIRTVEGLEIGTLKELDLSDCKFEVLMGDTFAGFPDIYSLNLSGNSIREINKDTFTDMISLRYLDLSRNNIRGPLDQFLFEFNHQLETLSFAGNKELDTFPGFLREFGALYKLDLSDCGLNSLSAYSFKGMPFIDTLNISGNNLGHIPPKTFYGLAHLTVLDISRNRLYGLSNKIFFNNLHLRKLFVSHNYFSTLPAILFSGTPALSWLDMSHNHIIRLWNISESFVMKNRNILGKLTYLNAAGNRLKTLHMHSFISMRGLETLDISGNPIMCTQDFSHVMQWLIGQKVVPSLEMGRNADSANLIKNNIQWQETLDQMCPIDAESRNVAYKSQSLVNKVKLHVDKSGQETFKEVTENPEMIEDVPYIISPVSDESSIVWPMVLVWLSIVSIMLAIGNIFAFVIYKYCRGHNTVHYTPAPSLSGHFLVRRGGKSEYKKLYAECTEPAQVHANNSKIITILGFPQSSKINSNV